MASARSSISFKWLVFFAFSAFVPAAAALLAAILSFFVAAAAFLFADSTFLRAVFFLFVSLIASFSLSLS
jgi:hypothetical protein